MKETGVQIGTVLTFNIPQVDKNGKYAGCVEKRAAVTDIEILKISHATAKAGTTDLVRAYCDSDGIRHFKNLRLDSIDGRSCLSVM